MLSSRRFRKPLAVWLLVSGAPSPAVFAGVERSVSCYVFRRWDRFEACCTCSKKKKSGLVKPANKNSTTVKRSCAVLDCPTSKGTRGSRERCAGRPRVGSRCVPSNSRAFISVAARLRSSWTYIRYVSCRVGGAGPGGEAWLTGHWWRARSPNAREKRKQKEGETRQELFRCWVRGAKEGAGGFSLGPDVLLWPVVRYFFVGIL